jgi:hypothetical protein
LNFVRQPLNTGIVNINAGVRIEQKQIHAVEFDSVHLGFRREVEHRIELDARLGAGAALADQPGPHGVVKLGEIAVRVLRAHKSCIRKLLQKLCRRLPGTQWQSNYSYFAGV